MTKYRAFVLVVIACGGAAAIGNGCGSTDDTRSSSRTSSVAPRAPAEVYVRRDEPPGGVPREIQYFQEGSPPPCSGFLAQTLSLGVGHTSSHEMTSETPYKPTRATDGDRVFVCVDPTLQEAEVGLRVRYPGGELRGSVRPSEAPQWEVPVSAGFVGKYHVQTVYPSGAEVTFTLEPARTPAYRLSEEAGRTQSVLLVGLKPRESVDLHFYETPETVRPSGTPSASYRATQHVRADNRGRMLVHLDPRATSKGHCYVIKAEV
jgi:hypothetical protein